MEQREAQLGALRAGLVWALVCLILAACGRSNTASPAEPLESENPILETFSNVPESASQQEGLWISYIDFEAAQVSRGLKPLTAEQVEAIEVALASPPLNDQGRDEWNLLTEWANAVGFVKSDLDLWRFVAEPAEMREAVGFTVFDVRRQVVYGQPPSLGVVLTGTFDVAAIEAVLAERGYVATNLAGAAVWCGEAGCDSGHEIDPANENDANPFGGNFGLREPLMVTDSVLLNSRGIQAFTQLVETHRGEQSALSEHPDFRALAEAAYAIGPTVQMHIFPDTETFLRPLELRSDLDSALAETLTGFGILPAYSLWGMADIRDEAQQTAALMLVYDSEDEAAAGGAELRDRLMTRFSLRPIDPPLLDQISELGGEIQPQTVYQSSTGKFVAVILITYPMPPLQFEEDGSMNLDGRGGVLYSRLSLLYARQLYVYLVSDVLP